MKITEVRLEAGGWRLEAGAGAGAGGKIQDKFTH
jgi:hypothetical protein